MIRRAALCLPLVFLLSASAVRWDVRGTLYQNPNRNQDTYLRLEVVNQEPGPVKFDIRLRDGWNSQQFASVYGQTLEGGAARTYHLPLPFESGAVNLSLESRGSPPYRPGVNYEQATVLHVAPVEAWATEQEMVDFTTATTSSARTTRHAYSSSGAVNYVAQIDPRESMPTNWKCYLPFDVVYISEDVMRRLPAEEMRALDEWMEAGGSLCVYNARGRAEEPRLAGRIEYRAENPIRQPRFAKMRATGVYDPFLGRMRSVERPPPPLRARVGGLVLGTLFLLIAGPANYIYWRRRGRIRMLLVSLPALSIGMCLLLLGYFLVTAGFTVEGRSLSLTALDQSRDAGVTVGEHEARSGLYPFGGFHFDARTMLVAQGSAQSQERDFDMTSDLHLRSGLFQPGVPFLYRTMRPFQTREKLIYEPDKREVVNGLEVGIERMLLLDGEQIWEARGLAPGQRGKLTPVDGQPDWEHMEALYLRQLRAEGALDESTWTTMRNKFNAAALNWRGPIYLARLSGPPDTTETGVELSGSDQEHHLLGFIAASGQ